MYEQISDTVRIERGPARVTVTADTETLKRLHPRYQPGTRDAAGQLIEQGQDMVILERHQRVWYVYRTDENGSYQVVSRHADRAAAVAAAQALEG